MEMRRLVASRKAATPDRETGIDRLLAAQCVVADVVPTASLGRRRTNQLLSYG
jgi:hypothetical protein